MGRPKVRNLERVIDELFKNYNNMLIRAMMSAGAKAREDIFLQARFCLYDYYDNYDPIWYDRTDSLKRAFVPYSRKSEKISGEKISAITIYAGVEYHPENLDGIYHGSKKWENVDGSWVLNNYLEGLHPIGSNVFFVDPISPNTAMHKFLNEYINTFENNVVKFFANQLLHIK